MFWWNLYCDGFCEYRQDMRDLFQSLFWWGLYCDTFKDLDIEILVWFQSLFWWILYCDKYLFTDKQQDYIGFNPCFGGSHIVTLSPLRHPFFFCKFQSLFWWISYCDGSDLPSFLRTPKFQSLFWWISYCDFPVRYSLSVA